MTEETLYQVLGVHPTASQAIIEAAYQRIMRRQRVETALLRRAQSNVIEDDQWLLRVQEAYDVLHDPVRRQNYDARLQDQATSASVELAEDAQRRVAESGAWLSEQRHEDGEIVFRIGWAANYGAVYEALLARIPAADRQVDSAQREWRVAATHAPVLRDLFDNYQDPDAPPPPDLPRPVYQRKEVEPTRRGIREPWEHWPLLLITGMALAIILTVTFPANAPPDRAAMATATAAAAALIDSLQQTEGVLPTPDPLDPTLLPAVPSYPSVHVRAGPGTDQASLGFLYEDNSYWVAGRTADNSWVVVVAGDGLVGWSAAWTLTIDGSLNELPIYAADAVLPDAIPVPTSATTPTPQS